MNHTKKHWWELGESNEAKKLKQIISEKEQELAELITDTEQLKNSLSVIKQRYDTEIGRLYLQLEDIEIEICQIKTIEELVAKWLSCEEAEMIIWERTRKEKEKIQKQYAEIQDQEDEIEKRKKISEDEQNELKQLYKKLALKFHPDLNNGDDTHMKKINRAYEQNDLETLRILDQNESIKDSIWNDIEKLKEKLEKLVQSIATKELELEQIKSSEWYVLKENIELSKKKKLDLFQELEEKIKLDIINKTAELAGLRK